MVVVALTAIVIWAAVGCGQTASRPHPSVAPTQAGPLAPPNAPPSPTLASARSAVATGTATAPTASKTAAPASAPALRPLRDVTGRGYRTTQRFRTPATWAITYRFDCTRYGAEGNFQVVVYAQGRLVEVAVNRVAWHGYGRAFEQQVAGETHLQINSECDWQVVAQP